VAGLASTFTNLASATAATCDRACLLEHGKQFNANMLAHNTGKIPLASNVQIRENTKAITLADTKWSGVKRILSEGVYADAIKGNVIQHVAAETNDGKTVYIGTRLKLADGKISEIEINFDDRPDVNIKEPRSLRPDLQHHCATGRACHAGAVGAHHHFLLSGADRPQAD
jgi:hypothetical protein